MSNETRLARNARMNGTQRTENEQERINELKVRKFLKAICWLYATNVDRTFTDKFGVQRNFKELKPDFESTFGTKQWLYQWIAEYGLAEVKKLQGKVDIFDLSTHQTRIRVSNPDMQKISEIALAKENQDLMVQVLEDLHRQAYKTEQTIRTIASDWSEKAELEEKFGLKPVKAPEWAW